MAAVSDASQASVVALRHMAPEDLEPLLSEEERVWRTDLDWDFRPSSSLVRRFTGMRALNGHGLWVGGRAVGYCYFVCEDQKGLIGDLYVMREYASAIYENRLMAAALASMMEAPFLRRIESQLMMLSDAARTDLPRPEFLKSHLRNFMRVNLASALSLPAGRAAGAERFETWTEERHDEAAQLIVSAYQDHVDSDINDQYRSNSGARRFLTNIVQYPGCGTFFEPASFVATDPQTGGVDGICLASLVSEESGHITQVCVSSRVRGKGLGYELIRRSLLALAAHKCRYASLTVTTANRGAVALYNRMGFATMKQFTAHVWEGF